MSESKIETIEANFGTDKATAIKMWPGNVTIDELLCLETIYPNLEGLVDHLNKNTTDWINWMAKVACLVDPVFDNSHEVENFQFYVPFPAISEPFLTLLIARCFKFASPPPSIITLRYPPILNDPRSWFNKILSPMLWICLCAHIK